MTETTTIKPKNSYELYMLLSPASIDGDVSAVEETIGKILQKHGAQIERSDRFAKKNLAYNMQKFGYAYAASVYFFAPTESIKEITAELNTSEIQFLRIMITKAEKRMKMPSKPRRTKPKPKTQETEVEIPEPEAKEETPVPAAEKAPEKPESSAAKKETTKESEATETDVDKVTLDDIDKRLDEIMEQL